MAERPPPAPPPDPSDDGGATAAGAPPTSPVPRTVLLPRRRDDRVILLDGGTSTGLQRAGHRLDDALWTARLLIDDPDALVSVHTAFLSAGAQVVTTASYQLATDSLTAAGRDPEALDPLLARSVALGRRAVEIDLERRGGPRPLVAASVGPYGAILADGSEYRGHYGLTEGALVDFHAPRVMALAAAGADVLACETIPSGTELAALARVLGAVPIPAYASVTLGPDGTTTAEGQPLDEAVAPLLEQRAVVAVGVNCCPPELVGPALEVLGRHPLPLVAKPNVGERWDAAARRWVPAGAAPVPVAPPARSGDAAGWIAAGARLIGGCCGTGPDDLAVLARAVAAVNRPSR